MEGPLIHLSFSTLDKFFALAAGAGALVVLGRLAAMTFGGDLDADGGSATEDFHILSLQGLSSFSLMFGLVGLALRRQSGAGAGLAVLGGLAGGLLSLWVLVRLFRLALGLQGSGTLPSSAAEGCAGTVVETLPAGGVGRVNVRIGQRLREMDAVHADGGSLPTGTPVRVVRVDTNRAVVRPLSLES